MSKTALSEKLPYPENLQFTTEQLQRYEDEQYEVDKDALCCLKIVRDTEAEENLDQAEAQRVITRNKTKDTL